MATKPRRSAPVKRGPQKQHKPRHKMPTPARVNQVRQVEHFYPYLVRFLEYTRVKGLSEQTVATRDRGLRRFMQWCEDRGLQEPNVITRPILERYQAHLFYYRKANGEPLSYGSQHALLSPLKAFFKWLTRENYIPVNPASELELPRQSRRIPRHILSVDQIKNIFGHVDVTTPYGVRNRAMLETLYSTGIRRMELVNLHLYDIDVYRHTLLVREGKGRKDRLIPLGERALHWVEKYRREARGLFVLPPDDGTLFLTDYGEPWIKNRLSTMVKKYLGHAGIETPGACHLFRHAMATHMLENGADIRFIQAMLGHSDLSTTQIYTQVAIGKLQAIHASTHPTADLIDKK